DERIDPETFIKKIQIEKNPPSPSLVPFLTKAINQWKQMRGNQSISISKFFEMIPPQTQPAPSAQSTTQASNQQSQQQQNTPIVISASGSNASSNTSSQATANSSGIPIITSISQGSLSHGQNVLILNGQYTIQPQFSQSGGKVTIQQQQQHMQQSAHGANIALAKVAASSQYQAQSPQQMQQNAQAAPASVKILNTSITNLKQITSPINQSTVMSPMAGISSPIKIEQHHLGQQTPQSPAKLISKVVKMEEIQPKIKTESDDDSSSMFGVDLEAEKKSLMGSGGAGRAIDQIRVFKEEKFLNIMILHKKFVEIAKKHKLDDVSVDVATLVSHATQEYLRGILEKLNVVSQHRLDLSMRVNIYFV
ncbi:transcription initiation factor TFIID subunit, partial [Brachionus plicatilis]